MTNKILEQKIAAIISPSIEDMGYRLVRIRFNEGKNALLQIMAERKSDNDLGIEDCEAISRTVSSLMDVEDPITSAYRLEVSSPGIDRPLVRIEDFERYKGFDAKLSTEYPLGGRKRFSGKITTVEENKITIVPEDKTGPFEIPLEAVDSAKLILTDALLKHATAARKEAKAIN